MALIIKKIRHHREKGVAVSKTYYLSSLSPTGWTEDESLATPFCNTTGNAHLAALHTAIKEGGKGELLELSTEVTEKHPSPSDAAALMGSIGGSATTEAKRLASRTNGRKGGRPKGSITNNTESGK